MHGSNSVIEGECMRVILSGVGGIHPTEFKGDVQVLLCLHLSLPTRAAGGRGVARLEEYQSEPESDPGSWRSFRC